MHAQEEINEI